MLTTYSYRIKGNTDILDKMARAVNFVWNFCNNTQKHALQWRKKWPSGFDLMKLAAGSYEELRVSSASIGMVCQQYAKSRYQSKRPYLRYRGKNNLGWVPIKGETLRFANGVFINYGKEYRVWYSRPIPTANTSSIAGG